MVNFATLPTDWELKPLGEIAEFLDHKRVPVKESEREQRRGPYPYYGANGLVGWIDGFLFDEPLVLMAEDGGCFGSKTHPITYKIEGKSWVNNHAHVLRPKSSETLDLDYLHWVLKFYDVTPFLSGTTRFKLTKTDASRIPMPIPRLESQKRIATIFERTWALKQKREQASQMTNKILQAIFLQMFGDPIENPNSWELEKLEQLTDRITKGESPKWQGFDYVPNGPRFIRSENVEWGYLDLTVQTRIPGKFHQKLERSKLHPGDVLINLVGASIGRAAVVPHGIGDSNINQAVAVITPKAELEPTFLVNFLISPSVQSIIHQGKVDAARANTSLGDLRSLTVPSPPHELQMRFTSIAQKVESMKQRQAESVYEISRLFSSIMSKAFKGELARDVGIAKNPQQSS